MTILEHGMQTMGETPRSGRVVVVTGSGQGIGRRLATAFAEQGATVVVADIDGTRAQDVATAIGADAHAATVDVGEPGSVTDLVEGIVDRHGRLDVLVNSAARFSTLQMQPFGSISLQEWEAVLRVNLTGTFLCCQAAVPAMAQQGSGRIVNLSSSTVLTGRPNYAHYVASKAGVVGLTRALARELGPLGVTVNAIMPGSVETEVPRDSVTPEQAQSIVDAQAIGRRLTVDDMTGAVLFLASPDAEMITGQTVVVDGGLSFV